MYTFEIVSPDLEGQQIYNDNVKIDDYRTFQSVASDALLRSPSNENIIVDLKYPTNNASLTVALLVVNMIGSGILNQLYVFQQSGIVGALGSFTVTTMATIIDILCLTAAGVQEQIFDYSGVAKRLLSIAVKPVEIL